MTTSDLNKLIAEARSSDTITSLHRVETIGLNQITAAYKAREINWLQELAYRLRFNSAIYDRSKELMPRVYS